MAPIGVFDSGVGGLTVLRALRAALPAQDFIYLGDTARLPYGTKSPETVARYSLQCATALITRGISGMVVACNTASASALDSLRLRYPDIPVIGVIEPGAAAAVAASRTQHIAVIGTEGTIAGGAYQAAIRRLSATARVVALPCALFVAMAEEGWTEGPIAEAVARRYLDPIFSPGTRDAAPDTGSDGEADGVPYRGADGIRCGVAGRLPGGGSSGVPYGRPDGVACGVPYGVPHGVPYGVPDTLVLGCTHFPALAPAIRKIIPPHVRIVDSAETTAAAVLRQWSRSVSPGRGGVQWLATDGAARFARVSTTFLGAALAVDQIEVIDL